MEQLYPKVVNGNIIEPSAPPLNLNNTDKHKGDNFRLQHISKIQNDLRNELNNYSRCRRRYSSAFNAVSNIHSTFSGVTIMTSSTDLGLVVSGIGIPAGIALAGVSVGCGVGSLISDIILKKVNKKLQKHIAISQLANSKISSIQKLISTALEDESISDSDFKKIVDDYENYQSQKQSIQAKILSDQMDINSMKTRFLEEGKKLGMEEANKKLKHLLEKSDTK